LHRGKGGGLKAVFKPVVAECTPSTSKQLALLPPTRCISTVAQSRNAHINFMSVMNTILSQSCLSGLACGRCRIKYTARDRLTTISVINFVTEIGCTRPDTYIAPGSSCTLPCRSKYCHVYQLGQQVSPVLVCRQDNS